MLTVKLTYQRQHRAVLGLCGVYTVRIFLNAALKWHAQCRINHVADVANATGLRPKGGLRK